MKLSRYEQEVVIHLNADEDEATVYAANPAWIRKMDKLHREFPEIIRLKSWTEVSKTYVLPKNLVRIGKPITLSEAQLRHSIFQFYHYGNLYIFGASIFPKEDLISCGKTYFYVMPNLDSRLKIKYNRNDIV